MEANVLWIGCWCACVIQWIDVTGRGIDDIHEELHHLAVDVIQSACNKELGQLWMDVMDSLTTDHGS